jgi:hypothetical protein
MKDMCEGFKRELQEPFLIVTRFLLNEVVVIIIFFFFIVFCFVQDEPWLLERYHPVEIERRAAEASRSARARAAAFASRVGPSFGRAPLFESGAAQLDEDDDEEEKEEEGAVVLVRQVGASLSSAALRQLAEEAAAVHQQQQQQQQQHPHHPHHQGEQQQQECVREVWLGAPVPGRRFTREALLRCASPALAARVAAGLEGRSAANQLLGATVAARATPRTRLVSAAARTAERVARDLQSAASLAEALDNEAGVLARGWTLEPGASDAARLDALLLYLRKVHLYSYYSWTQYHSRAHMLVSCPVFLRPAQDAKLTGRDEVRPKNKQRKERIVFNKKENKAWAETLDFHTAARISQAYAAGARTGRVEVEKAVATLQVLTKQFVFSLRLRKNKARNCQSDGEGRFRCVECRKVFLTPEFVGKHLLNKVSLFSSFFFF